MHVRTFSSFQVLPPAYSALFAHQSERNLFLSQRWLEDFASKGLEAGTKLRLFGVEDNDAEADPLALLVGFLTRLYPAHHKARTLFFSAPEGGLFTPFVNPVAELPAKVLLERVVADIRTSPMPYDVLRFSPLDRDAPFYSGLVEILRAAGLVVQPYHMFTNRYEITKGMQSTDYFQSRSSSFRHNLKRRRRKLEDSVQSRFELITGGDALERALSDCTRIFDASWKDPREISVDYTMSITRASADAGALRLGLLYVADEPAAMQLCVVSSGAAKFLRTAYDKRFKQHSVGMLVIQAVVEHVIDVDRVTEIDFGVGDHSYKKDWATQRRERWGLAAFNPRTARGVKAIVSHVGGRAAKRSAKRVIQAVRKLGRGAG